MKKPVIRTVFCCAKCLGYVKYALLDVNQRHTKVCMPCTNDTVRKSRIKARIV